MAVAKRDQHDRSTYTTKFDGDRTSFLGRLLQYYIIEAIDLLDRDSFSVSVGGSPELTPGMIVPDPEPYPTDRLFKELDHNPFFSPPSGLESADHLVWAHKSIVMPKGTNIRLSQDNQHYVTRLERPSYFTAHFAVEPSICGGSTPRDFLTTDKGNIIFCGYFIELDYVIHRKSDHQFQPEKYADWLNKIFTGLRKEMENN